MLEVHSETQQSRGRMQLGRRSTHLMLQYAKVSENSRTRVNLSYTAICHVSEQCRTPIDAATNVGEHYQLSRLLQVQGSERTRLSGSSWILRKMRDRLYLSHLCSIVAFSPSTGKKPARPSCSHCSPCLRRGLKYHGSKACN
jgi:hypothetical protein